MNPSFETLIQNLTSNLFSHFVFYLPHELFKGVELSEENRQNIEHNLDTVFYVDAHLKRHKHDNQSLYVEVLKKRALLNSNTFILLTQKEIRKPYQFAFILDEYQKILDFNLIVAEWMAQKITVFLPNTPQDVKNALQLQSDYFKNHQKELNNYLELAASTPQPPNDMMDFVASNFKELNNKLSAMAQNQISQVEGEKVLATGIATKEKVETNEEPIITINKKRRKQLITDEEARKFLLKTVFRKN